MKDYITDFDQLYNSMQKCRKGVSWKPSVKSFILNSEENLLRMERQLKEGTWKNGKPKPILITYPKRREGLSIPFKDRVYQRSINDNALYPQMSRHFAYANCACQKGKGTDFARKLVKKYLWNHYCKYGTEGYVIQVDIHGYYLNMRHKDVEKCFADGADLDTCRMSVAVLNEQYAGETGYNPGSQMVQIAGIALLNELDHHVKEKLHVRYYIRYMDDFWILAHKKSDADYIFKEVERFLYKYGLQLNKKKSHVRALKKGFMFLGFNYRIMETGKVIMTLDSKSIKHERKTLVRMVHKEKRMELESEKTNEHHRSWEDNASKGNSYKLTQRTKTYLKELRKDG